MARRQPQPTTPPKPTAQRNRALSTKLPTTPPLLSNSIENTRGDDYGDKDDDNVEFGQNFNKSTIPGTNKHHQTQHKRQPSSTTFNLTHETRFRPYDDNEADNDGTPTHTRALGDTTADMDMDIHAHTPTSFSPSKARAQAKQTHQLTLVKQWMTSLLLDQASSSPSETPSLSSTAQSGHAQSQTNYHHQYHHQQQQRQRSLALITKWETEYLSLMQVNPSLAQSTFQSLQDLMFTNQTSDETRRLLHNARAEELALLRQQEISLDASSSSENESGETPQARSSRLLDEIQGHLSPRALDDLDTLAESAVLLGVMGRSLLQPSYSSPSSAPTILHNLAQPLFEITHLAQNLQTEVSELERVIEKLSRQLEQVRAQVVEFETSRESRERKAEGLQARTAQWQRETKQIQIKIQEYQERIAVLGRTRPGSDGNECVRVEEVVDIQRRVEKNKRTVEILEERIKAFGGLPPDIDASRAEVRRARRELADLKRRREDLFEAMMD